MSLDSKKVNKIAHLARLSIANKSEQEIDETAQDLNKILDWVGQMQEVNTDNIEPMAHPLEAMQRLRPDENLSKDEHHKYQKIAPKVEAGLYLVPTVIE